MRFVGHKRAHLLFMLISKKISVHQSILFALLLANVLLFGTWVWLPDVPLRGDSSDNNVLRDEILRTRFFKSVNAEKKVFFMGTSESLEPFNLASQLNWMAPENPQMVVIANSGMSPIHSCLIMAQSKRERLTFPPMVLVINPVYFTSSHDVINDGWLSRMVRSPVFLQMNHRDIRTYLSEEVQQAYSKHFALKRVLYPVWAQEYAGNLLYLRFHMRANESEHLKLPDRRYEFDGVLPNYDKARSVWAGYRASDKILKSRWRVNLPEDALNLKGLAATLAILKDQPAPVLLLMMPVNRTFYEYNGLNMAEFDQRYRQIRQEISELASAKNSYFLDFFDEPKLHFGFQDRMHMDMYGYAQLAPFMLRSDEYQDFVEAVRSYYGETI